jgi:type IV pilus assembly protein PilC
MYSLIIEVVCVAVLLTYAIVKLRGRFVALIMGVARILGWMAFFVALLAAMIFVGGPFGLLLWLATLVIALMIVSRYRDTERQMLLWSLGMAAEKGIPLPAAARAFSDERRGSVGRRAAKLAVALERGMPLDAAVKAAQLRLSPAATVAVRTGCETGSLGATLAGASRASAFIETTTRGATSQIIYLTFFVLIAMGIIGFIQYKIVPELIKIFDGFSMRLPGVTVFAVNSFYWLYTPIFFLLLLPLLMFVLLFAIGRFVGVVSWDPPLLRKLTSRLDEAIVLRSLGAAVEQCQALPAAVVALADSYPKRHIRKRLHFAEGLIGQGANWCDSLQAAGMLRPVETAVLKSAERVDNLPWALREMADRQVRRFTSRLTAVLTLVYPVALVIIASVVLLAALVIFLPMIDLIETVR